MISKYSCRSAAASRRSKPVGPRVLATFCAAFCAALALARPQPLRAEPSAGTSPTAAQCLAHHRSAQLYHRDVKLLEAAAEYRSCLHPACAKAVRADCWESLRQVDADTPSVVFAASRAGQDLGAVQVYVGDRRLQAWLSGVSVELNPGLHRFRFVAEDAPAIERRHLVRMGEKNRIISVEFPAGPAHVEPRVAAAGPKGPSRVGRSPAPLSDVPEGAAPSASSSGRWLFLLGGTVGLGAAATGYYAWRDFRAAQNECSPECSRHVRDRIDTKQYVAGGMAGVSAALFAVGFWRWQADGEPASSTVVGLSPYGFELSGRF